MEETEIFWVSLIFVENLENFRTKGEGWFWGWICVVLARFSLLESALNGHLMFFVLFWFFGVSSYEREQKFIEMYQKYHPELRSVGSLRELFQHQKFEEFTYKIQNMNKSTVKYFIEDYGRKKTSKQLQEAQFWLKNSIFLVKIWRKMNFLVVSDFDSYGRI